MCPAAGPAAPLRPPPKCNACQDRRVAWSVPRVDYCYQCLPGGPFAPPLCRACGSGAYFSQGLCERCHPGGPLHLGSCKSCLAWGVYRQQNWMCGPCRWWQTHYPEGECDYCGRVTALGEQRACRLCLEHARLVQEPGRALDLTAAKRHGQQLFLANMAMKRRPRTPRLQPPPQPGRRPSRNKPRKSVGGWNRPGPPPAELALTDSEQPGLFPMAPDPEVLRQRALIEDSELTRYCAAIIGEHAERYGWSKRQRNDVVRSLRLLQTLRDSPTAKIRATDVLQLPTYDGNIVSTLDVLAAADLLIEDRPSRVERYFASKTSSLPEPMRSQLETWLRVMLDGSTTPPRRRERDPQTARVQILGLAPILLGWAADGHTSLAQITTNDITEALPPKGSRRAVAETGSGHCSVSSKPAS